MKRINCSLIEDLMPLYNEGEVSGETKVIIKAHLEECSSCRNLYGQAGKNVFAEAKLEEPEMPKDKRFLMKAKRTIYAISAVLILVIASSTVLSFEVGKKTGVYAERFRLAEEKNLFIDVNQERDFDGSRIILEKVLLDNSVTSLIVKSSYDFDRFDSVTLKDDKGNYYGKINMFTNSVPQKYQKSNGYTVLNFKPVSGEVKALELELINWHPVNKLSFTVDIRGNEQLKAVREYEDVVRQDINGVGFSIDRVVLGTSQSEVYCTFDRTGTDFDGVTLGWYYKDTIENRNKAAFRDEVTGNMVRILSIEDVTHEKDMKAGVVESNSRDSYRFILNPVAFETQSLKLQLEELYGYYGLGNKELTLDFTNQSALELNKEYNINGLRLLIKSARLDAGKINLVYQVRNSTGETMNSYILDARIRNRDEKHAVPVEGTCSLEDSESSVVFNAGADKQYVVSLARLGIKLQSEASRIELR